MSREALQQNGPVTAHSHHWLKSNSVADMTASQFRAALATGDVSVEAYTSALLDRIATIDDKVHAWKSIDPDAALRRARVLDDRRSRGDALRSLGGVPVGVKDIFNTYDLPTSMGSPIMEGYTPGNDARVVSNIRLDDGIILGKTVTAEFAVHQPGPTVNPHSVERTPGTSSSGSAVAVATRTVPVALASQTGGSIIRPASYCGIMGFKPSFGLVPRTAMLKTTDTLDTVGYMARSVDDLRLLFDTTRVRGHNYPVTEEGLERAERSRTRNAPWRVAVLRHAIRSHEGAATSHAFDRAVEQLARSGCDIVEFALPNSFDVAWTMHERIYRRALAYYFKIEWAYAPGKFSPAMRDMITGGLEISPAEYHEAIAAQRALACEFDELSTNWDVLVAPSTADEAPMAQTIRDLPDTCLVWTMVGAPVIGLPALVGKTGLPVGIQLVGRRFSDYKLLDFCGFVAGELSLQ